MGSLICFFGIFKEWRCGFLGNWLDDWLKFVIFVS